MRRLTITTRLRHAHLHTDVSTLHCDKVAPAHKKKSGLFVQKAVVEDLKDHYTEIRFISHPFFNLSVAPANDGA